MLNILPQPNKITYLQTEAFVFSDCLCVPLEQSPAAFWQDFEAFLTTQGIRLQNGNDITVTLSEEMEEEAYTLTIEHAQIAIRAKTEKGAFYALQTLKQILIQQKNRLPAVHIADKPRFAYRGFMLDVGRYFYPVRDVKRYLDLMALHKLNYFHWHLTEDQGWRIEIKAYPLLSEKGSKRSHTNFGIRPHGGFYTQDEIREVVQYAHTKYIKVIPEFDIPGHMVSAIACYPELSCFHRKLPVATHWGVKHDIICAGKESTYEFVYNVLDEFVALFPDGMIHLGGDEADKTRWNICPNCNKVLAKHGLKTMDELQQVFMSNINQYLRQKGVKSAMWGMTGGEAPAHLDTDILWFYYHPDEATERTTKNELKNGRDIINSTSKKAYYLDFPYGWNNLQEVYAYEPDTLVSNGQKGAFLGVEAPLWTEYVPNSKKGDYMTFPRLCAMAETAWSNKGDKNYEDFLIRLNAFYQLLDVYNVHYASVRQAMPNKLRAALQSLWFNRRVMHWEGVHNFIDDSLVKRRASKR